ncbi:MAG: family 16 glycosylhydrolase [Mangrovibacterium sp.]
MKRLICFSILLLPLLGVAINSGGRESKTPADQNPSTPAHILKNYQIVWEDEFNGTTLNTSKWKYRNEGKSAGKYATISKNNIELDGKGHMLIKITKDSDGKYYTGSLDTRKIFETTYGYFECRAAMHKQLGPEVVFRLYSADYGKTLDPAKDGAMISIFQYHRQTPVVQHAVYWNSGADRQKDNKLIQLKDIGKGFHTFGLEWTQDEYIFYVDGKETWRTSVAVSQRNEYLILLADLSGWGGDPAQGNFPDAITFDYVKVYKPK